MAVSLPMLWRHLVVLWLTSQGNELEDGNSGHFLNSAGVSMDECHFTGTSQLIITSFEFLLFWFVFSLFLFKVDGIYPHAYSQFTVCQKELQMGLWSFFVSVIVVCLCPFLCPLLDSFGLSVPISRNFSKINLLLAS